jgi:DNA-binding CsgD family transcriptional regulator
MHGTHSTGPEWTELRRELLRRLAGTDTETAPWETLGQRVAFRQTVIAGRPTVVVALLGPPLDLMDDDALGRALGLSPRQTAVARLLARRMSARQAAAELGLAHATVRGHIETIYLRLGVHGRDELIELLHGRVLDTLAAGGAAPLKRISPEGRVRAREGQRVA